MKIICHPAHQEAIATLVKAYQDLDLVLVEKGFNYEGLCYTFSMDCLDQLVSYLNSLRKDYLLATLNERIYRIHPQDILYIEGFSKEAYFYTKEAAYKTNRKVYELEESLKSYHFIRINKSMLVNVDWILAIVPDMQRRYFLILENNVELVLTRNYVASFKQYLKGNSL